MTKKEMIARIIKLYGRNSKMTEFFVAVAKNTGYAHTKMIFFKIISKYH